MVIKADIAAALGNRQIRKQGEYANAAGGGPAHRMANQRVIQRHQAEHLHLIAEPVNGLGHRFHRINGKMQDRRRLARRQPRRGLSCERPCQRQVE